MARPAALTRNNPIPAVKSFLGSRSSTPSLRQSWRPLKTPVALTDPTRYNTLYESRPRAVSSAVRAPRSHRGGRRFKSSIAHHGRHTHRRRRFSPVNPLLRRGGETADALRSGRSVHYGRVGSNPSLGTNAKIQIITAGFPKPRACSSVDRALPCGGRGREFESRQARHFTAPPRLSL